MGEKARRRIDLEVLEMRRNTKILALQVVATNPGLPVSELSERFSKAAALQSQETNGGKPLRLNLGPGTQHQDLEQLLRELAGATENLLKMKGLDGTSTFELTTYGHRTLTINGRSSGTEAPTPQF